MHRFINSELFAKYNQKVRAYMSVFSERLKSTMIKKGITQAQLSLLTGIPKSAISQYLSDKFKPRQERIRIISTTLDISAAWLCGLDDTKHVTSSKKSALSDRERDIIHAYRSSPKFKLSVDEALDAISLKSTYDVFRAAKSEDGTVPPTNEEMTAARLLRLSNAPQTDEDL